MMHCVWRRLISVKEEVEGGGVRGAKCEYGRSVI